MNSQAVPDSLYRTVWRWHFYAGVLLAPVILIVSLTGLAYVFKRELETVIHGDVLLVEPIGSEAPLDRVVEAAEAAAGEGWSARLAEIDVDPQRAFGVFLNGPDDDHRRLYVDQYTVRVLGSIDDDSFFPVVLRLHRSLFAGSLGRTVTELAASWTIILTFSGLYLWWPRRSKRNRANWLVVPRRFDYRTLRDLHAVGGFWLSPVLVVMAVTGLYYSLCWGNWFRDALDVAGVDGPLVMSEPLTPDQAGVNDPWAYGLAAARQHAPDLLYTISWRGDPEKPLTVYAGGLTGPSLTRVLRVAPADGVVVAQSGYANFPLAKQYSGWNYPLHVGSFWGVPSKFIWAAASLGLALMPVTGVWMWLKRRPQGRLGVPGRGDALLQRGSVTFVVVLGCLLPLAGVSFVVAWLGDRLIASRLTAKS